MRPVAGTPEDGYNFFHADNIPRFRVFQRDRRHEIPEDHVCAGPGAPFLPPPTPEFKASTAEDPLPSDVGSMEVSITQSESSRTITSPTVRPKEATKSILTPSPTNRHVSFNEESLKCTVTPKSGGIPPFNIERLVYKEPSLISGIKLNPEGGDAPEAHEEGELSEQEMDLGSPRPNSPPPATSSPGSSPGNSVPLQKVRRNKKKRR